MVEIKINGKTKEVAKGTTLIAALKDEGISVPTMCYLENTEHFPTCMMCIVKDERNGQMIPSCSTMAAEGMEIISNDDEVIEARKTGLEYY